MAVLHTGADIIAWYTDICQRPNAIMEKKSCTLLTVSRKYAILVRII